MRFALCLAIAVLASTAEAQEGLRDTDRILAASDLSNRLSGHSVEFFDDSRAIYRADGSYQYAYTPDDDRFQGVWEITSDSMVCVTFDDGLSRCDTYVLSGDRLTMIVANGDRYPARAVTSIK